MSTGGNQSKLRIACEVGVDRVIAARASESGNRIEVYSTRKLTAGALNPGLNAPNVVEREALTQAVSGTLSTVAGATKDVIVVLPDSAVRVLMVDFDTLPEKIEDAAAIIRFRVKKSLPFDVDHAALSYHVQRANGTVKVIAAISPKEVVEEYETVFREAGYLPGVVMPSVLATLELVETDRPTMVVKIDANTTTVAIVNRDELTLLRTIDHPTRSRVSASELAESVHPSLIFFEDTYASKIDLVQLTGMADLQGVAAELERETGVRTEELASGSRLSGEGLGDTLPGSMLTSVAGALLGR